MTTKTGMTFNDAITAWERVAPWPYDDAETNDEGEMSIAILSNSDSPMVHFFMDDPTERIVTTMTKMVSDYDEAKFVFYPLGGEVFSVVPASIVKSDNGIMVDTLERKTDFVVRPIEKEDSVWAIGKVVETIRELFDEIERMDR